MFVVGLIAAAAVPLRPHGGHVSAAPTPLVVGDRTVRMVSLGGPGTDRLLSRIAAAIGTAVGEVEAFWGVDWTRDISVVATGSDEQFRAAAGGGPASRWADIAAVTVVDSVDPARQTAVGQRIVFAPGAAGMSDAALRIVLAHELFHYAARRDTALDAPRWLTEGVADFIARPNSAMPDEVVSMVPSLPSDAELDTPGQQRSLGYDRSWWFARFVADSYGTTKLRELYLAACGVGHADMFSALRDVLGADPAGLLQRWQQWLVG
ncbi:hypothetical protein MLAC_21950 [Mycobacterium lacus]|uniref:eCIS core domain-containing protein n=1 Tax=Mycobacterium lacus TaxID=169765 RepID=A0A7I7NMD5_9MYCO|nr:hypothetical protein MLAC_21950 [Mycobacterium lacus]